MMLIKKLRAILSFYFVFVGVLAHVALLVGLVLALSYFQLTPRQFITKAFEKAGLEIAWLDEFIRPDSRFEEHQLDGRLREQHPRILLSGLAGWNGTGKAALIAERERLLGPKVLADYNPCGGGGVIGLAGCWLSRANAKTAGQLIKALKDFQVETPNVSSNYGNGWELAMAYDLIALSPDFSAADRGFVESKIAASLKDYLALLDDEGPSLWHGRTSLASMAWISASVLDGNNPAYQPLIAQAQGHFLDVVRALELSEAWPEGYNYWINSRAYVVVLALGAYVNALDGAVNQKRVSALIERIGLWHIYATRPDNRIEGIGDEGPRIDLKDETQRVIDIIAQLTRNPVFASYSEYLQRLHGSEGYYRDYRWGKLLFNDPTVAGWIGGNSFLEVTGLSLPKAELFGRAAMGLAYIRSGWGSNDTFISFRAGHSMVHHGHYDAGHFSLFKGKQLAINSSVYGEYMGENRLNYSLRTVAKNSLLILRPGEEVKPNRFFGKNVADGGQRITLPTGSNINGTQNWFENLNDRQHLAGGVVRQFEHDYRAGYSYLFADLTAAYNTPEHDEGGRGGKVKSVQRSLLYLEDEDRLLIYDKVESSEPGYTKKWLLHTVGRPEVAAAKVLVGSADNGILQSTSSEINVANGLSSLKVVRHLPVDGVARLVGGEDYQYYVEVDGDDSDLDGENFNQGAANDPWFDVGHWRIEIQPNGARLEDEFLMELMPGLDGSRVDRSHSVATDGDAKVLHTSRSLLIFVSRRSGVIDLSVPAGIERLLVVGLQESTPLSLVDVRGVRQFRASQEGVFFLNEALSEGRALKVSW